MPFGRQVHAATAQALAALSRDAAETLLYKHLNAVPADPGTMGFVRALLAELIGERNQLRHAAPTRHVLDSRVADLERWLFHDGWRIENGNLVTIAPAVEEATGVRDRLLDEFANSGVDADATIQQAISESAISFNATPPDFNDAIVKVRIALEPTARRAAAALAARRGLAYPQDSWGRAIALLLLTIVSRCERRAQGVAAPRRRGGDPNSARGTWV